MQVKETIAYIGDVDENAQILISKLITAGHSFVVINQSGKPSELLTQVQGKFQKEAIETIACEKEACWEADIILLANSLNPNKALLEKIKPVAAQKIVIFIAPPEANDIGVNDKIKLLKKELPHSKVVGAFLYNGGPTVGILGTSEELLRTLIDFFTSARIPSHKMETLI